MQPLDPPSSGRFASPPGPVAEGYRSAADFAVALRLLLTAWVVLGGIAVASDLAEFRVVSDLLSRPAFVSDQLVTSTDERQTVIAVIQVLGTLIVAGLFLGWTRRTYRNLWPLGVTGMRFRPGWAVGGWLVPLLNLVRPRQVIDDVWRAADPEVPAGSSAWVGLPVPALFHVWWALWIVGGGIGTWVALQPAPATLGDHRALTGITVILDAMQAAAALFGAWTVEQATRRQEAMAFRVLRAPRTMRRTAFPDAARYGLVATLGVAAFTAAHLALS